MTERSRTVFDALLGWGGPITPDEQAQIRAIIPYLAVTGIVALGVAYAYLWLIWPWHNVTITHIQGQLKNETEYSGVSYRGFTPYSVSYFLTGGNIFCYVTIDNFTYNPILDRWPQDPYASIINDTAPFSTCNPWAQQKLSKQIKLLGFIRR
jgi:hypothetical protein